MLKTVAPWIVVTGLDGSGKTGLVRRLAHRCGAHWFKLPYHDFVKEGLRHSGDGTQFGDVHTDRLILAADARLTHYRIRDWRREHKLLVSQRAWMDNFVFAAVQGCSYAETDALLCTADLERPSAASVADYIFRWLGMQFLPGYRETNTSKRHAEAPTTGAGPAATLSETAAGQPALAAPARGNGRQQEVEKPADAEGPTVRSQQFARFQTDAPPCSHCGAITVRNGTCYLCHNCGNSMGCS
jgi:hypothetical protein